MSEVDHIEFWVADEDLCIRSWPCVPRRGEHVRLQAGGVNRRYKVIAVEYADVTPTHDTSNMPDFEEWLSLRPKPPNVMVCLEIDDE